MKVADSDYSQPLSGAASCCDSSALAVSVCSAASMGSHSCWLSLAVRWPTRALQQEEEEQAVERADQSLLLPEIKVAVVCAPAVTLLLVAISWSLIT